MRIIGGKYNSALKYIASGLTKTLAFTVSGFVIFIWIEPQEIGLWQSFTVFTGYIHLLTLGTTSGLNRELPYWLGKGEKEIGINRLKAAGYYTTKLSLGILVLVGLISIILYLTSSVTIDFSLMLFASFSLSAINIQTNFLGATYRSNNAFDKLSQIQWMNTLIVIFLLPLIYFFNLWGYVLYQLMNGLYLFWGYFYYRPYRVKYEFYSDHLIELVKIGFPMYIWNYLSTISKTIPRLILVIFGSPVLVGLFAPSTSINSALLNLPTYINRYMFPQMSYKFGETNNMKLVLRLSLKISISLFIVMFISASLFALILPYVFEALFPNYIEGLTAARITLFSGVFYSINAFLHNTYYSVKYFNPIKYIVVFRFVNILISTYLAYIITENLLISVAIGAVTAEILNLFIHIYHFYRISR